MIDACELAFHSLLNLSPRISLLSKNGQSPAKDLAGNILHVLAGCRRRTAARRAPCIASGESRQNAQSLSCQTLTKGIRDGGLDDLAGARRCNGDHGNI